MPMPADRVHGDNITGRHHAQNNVSDRVWKLKCHDPSLQSRQGRFQRVTQVNQQVCLYTCSLLPVEPTEAPSWQSNDRGGTYCTLRFPFRGFCTKQKIINVNA